MNKKEILDNLAAVQTAIQKDYPNEAATIHECAKALLIAKFSQGQDLVGHKFGKLTVEGRMPHRGHPTVKWICRCECGETINLTTKYLLQHADDNTLSCRYCQRNNPENELHRLWKQIIASCYNPAYTTYKFNGAKGVKVHPDWRNSFPDFRQWAIQNGFGAEMTIKRISKDGDWTPDNCTVVRRNILTIDGVTHPLTQWCKIRGIPYITAYARMKKGFPPEVILARRKASKNNVELTLREAKLPKQNQ